MKRINTRLAGKVVSKDVSWWQLLPQILFSPFGLILAWFMGLPGIRFHLASIYIGVRLMFHKDVNSKRLARIYSLIFEPIDSIRYYEFDSLWNEVQWERSPQRILDVGSPRLFPIEFLRRNRRTRVLFVNPDPKDISYSTLCVHALDFKERVVFEQVKIEDLVAPENSFDLISSISVIEHLPDEKTAIQKMWSLLKPGGDLLLSVPCAAEPFEEYIDLDEYGLYTDSENDFVFGQRFYDETMLIERIFNQIGDPAYEMIIGEKEKGIFFQDRKRKIQQGHSYPFWKEPIRTYLSWKTYPTIESLPGVGVIILRFRKDPT